MKLYKIIEPRLLEKRGLQPLELPLDPALYCRHADVMHIFVIGREKFTFFSRDCIFRVISERSSVCPLCKESLSKR